MQDPQGSIHRRGSRTSTHLQVLPQQGNLLPEFILRITWSCHHVLQCLILNTDMHLHTLADLNHSNNIRQTLILISIQKMRAHITPPTTTLHICKNRAMTTTWIIAWLSAIPEAKVLWSHRHTAMLVNHIRTALETMFHTMLPNLHIRLVILAESTCQHNTCRTR